MTSNKKPTLVFMHHPLTKIGHKLFDSISCSTPQGFEKFIKSQKRILGIVTGHYHHFCLTSYGSKPCFIAPSIAPVHYFASPQDDYVTALELQEPAITLHKWHGRSLTSHIIRLRDEYLRIDWYSIKNKSITKEQTNK